MDRAGLVGADGATHCGAFDVTYMASLPNMVCMAPSNEAELINMVATATAIDDRPSCFRFPRGNGIGVDLAAEGITKDLKGTPLEVGNAYQHQLCCIASKPLLIAHYISAAALYSCSCKARLVRVLVMGPGMHLCTQPVCLLAKPGHVVRNVTHPFLSY